MRRVIAILLLMSLSPGCLKVRLPHAKLGTTVASHTLSWPEAVDLALRHHPDLAQAKAELLSSAHGRNAALGDFLPDADASYTRRRTRSTTDARTNTRVFDIKATQPVFTGFSTTGEYLQAKRLWEAQKQAYRETSADVRQRLRAAYAELLRQQALEETTRRIADRRQENAELIRLRYEAGREHRGSQLRAQAIADSAAFEHRQTLRRTDTQRLVLGRELGGQVWAEAVLSGDLAQLVPEAPAPPADYAALAEQAPTVQRAVKAAEAAKAQLLSTQSAHWPTVEASANYGYTGDRVEDLDDDASVALTVSLPLFAGGANVQNTLTARQDLRAAAEAARSARDERVTGLSTAWAGFRDAREFVDVRKQFLDAARERADIVREQYRSGLASFQDFDIAEQELADAERQHVDSLADVLVREAAWEEAKGSTLEEARNAR